MKLNLDWKKNLSKNLNKEMMSIREIENTMPGRKDLSAVLNSSVENFGISNELNETLGRANSNSRS